MGRCGVCKRPHQEFRTNLAVDHDHHTGEIRGLLCINCNRRIIGRHRTPAGEVLLRHAAEYLEGPYTGWTVPTKPKRKRRRSISSRTTTRKRSRK
ncbi:endonuclease domain-containing protein [Bradyrhizobium erythrophlei]|uniref:endonuclease domain-containing protein n=1 Tax=Bradyrhizobium erythrophlei TaxID=1437360 RepID=UPI003CC7F01F